MGTLTIHKEGTGGVTVVSNLFIDQYMKEANDAQIKVYLYLLRSLQSSRSVSVADMADLFNHTEKDILRALRYWEKKGLLAPEYDSSKNLTGIKLLSPKEPSVSPSEAPAPAQPADIVPLAIIKPSAPASPLPEKPSYSLDELKAFRDNEDVQQLLFIAETYVGKTLSSNDIQTILFLYDRLHFSIDLIDYLIQYCVDRGKRDFRYIEKVAVSWAEENITTPSQAKAAGGKYDKSVYAVMNALGKTSAPTPKEVTYITRWTRELGFDMPVIEAACERTVLATDKHRFEYADSILTSWKKNQVHDLVDVSRADDLYHKTKAPSCHTGIVSNQFNQFPQRDYDFDALEKELLSN